MSIKHFALSCAVAGLLCSAATSHANVYAAHLSATNTGGNNYNISYRLNEAADAGVTVKVKGPLPATTVVRTIAAGSQLKGSNTVAWDGKNDAAVTVASGSYSFEVTAAAVGYGAVTKISDEGPGLNKFLNFYTPYGVSVDKNPANATFGRIYVVNNAGTAAATPVNTADGRLAMTDGVYILSNDFQDITGQVDTAYNGGVAWLGDSSPFRVRVAPDGTPFICDWSDSHSGVWLMNPANPSAAFSELFDSTIVREAAPGGLRAGLHGSIPGLYVTGTGSGQVMTTIDEDLDLGGAGTGSLYSYAIGTATTGYNTPPTVTYNDATGGNLIQNMNATIAPGNGGWWISQYRSAESAAVPSLIHVTLSAGPTQTVDFNSASNLAGVLTGSTRGGIDISPDGTKLVYSVGPALKVLEIGTFPTVTLAYEAGATYTGTTSRDAAFDAAGNFYGSNSSAEYVRVYSPAGANSYTTPAPAAVTMSVAAGVNEWLNY